MTTISLAMIVRNSADSIQACLESVLPWVDEAVIVDTGSTDETADVVKEVCGVYDVPLIWMEYKDPAEHEKWISDFSVPRNIALDHCKCDYMLWMDADDVLHQEEVGDLRRLFERSRVPDAWTMRYDYGHDESGHCTQRQSRIRVARPGKFRWDGFVHENLHPTEAGTINDDPYDLPVWLIHKAGQHRTGSAERNLWIIEYHAGLGVKLDAHMWKGKGDALRSLGRDEEAIVAYTEALADGGDNQQRYLCLMRRGDCYVNQRISEKAYDDFARAERLKPEYKMAYLATAELMAEQCQWREALVWCDKADMACGDADSYFFNPFSGKAVPAKIRAEAYLQLGRYDDSLREYERLEELYGEPGLFGQRLGAIRRAKYELSMYEGAMALYEELPIERRNQLLGLLPDCLRKFPSFAKLTMPPRKGTTVAIFCGETANLWGPSAISHGVGGSEESAIYMSRELAKRGYHVEVYGSFHEADLGVDEHGVVWVPWHAWHYTEDVDIFIGWRHERALAELSGNCKQRWMWIQDVPVEVRYSKSFCEILDGVLCISEFQAGCLGENGLPKSVISANGVDPETLVDGPNDKRKFIYASSPDRGLEQLLEVWPRIHSAVPGSELHVFYGFRDIWLRHEKSMPKSAALRERIERMLLQPGVVNHGMVGQPELHKWFAECGFWLYPTSFEETFCVTAAKAQCMGAIPITSRYENSCLREVIGYDLGPPEMPGKIKENQAWLDMYAEAVIEASHTSWVDYRQEMKEWARDRFPWAKVADQWDSLFSGRSKVADHQPHLASQEVSAA